jgi:hypothetical protein
MVFIAVRPNGHPADMELPVSDPVSDKISVAPGTLLTGKINLENVIRDLRRVTKESDLHLFWQHPSALFLLWDENPAP